MTSNQKASITPSVNGPYWVADIVSFTNQRGPIRRLQLSMALCRCGASRDKPFCDGAHVKIGFSSANPLRASQDKRDTYEGREIAIHDNRSICAHAGYCTDGLPSVFRMKETPWIDPNGASREQVIRIVQRCPSGALSYSVDGVEHRDLERDPAISVVPDGPYVVTGGVELRDTSHAQGASTEHFTLCRCGGSRNKPFCDGTHWHIGFKDEKN